MSSYNTASIAIATALAAATGAAIRVNSVYNNLRKLFAALGDDEVRAIPGTTLKILKSNKENPHIWTKEQITTKLIDLIEGMKPLDEIPADTNAMGIVYGCVGKMFGKTNELEHRIVIADTVEAAYPNGIPEECGVEVFEIDGVEHVVVAECQNKSVKSFIESIEANTLKVRKFLNNEEDNQEINVPETVRDLIINEFVVMQEHAARYWRDNYETCFGAAIDDETANHELYQHNCGLAVHRKYRKVTAVTFLRASIRIADFLTLLSMFEMKRRGVVHIIAETTGHGSRGVTRRVNYSWVLQSIYGYVFGSTLSVNVREEFQYPKPGEDDPSFTLMQLSI